MAVAKKMNVLMIFLGRNPTETIPFFLNAHRFDRSTCPIVWYDGRHEYLSVNLQESAAERVFEEIMIALSPSVVVHLDDEAWLIRSLQRLVYWQYPAISLIQLKRTAIQNLRWMASLSPSALAGIPLRHTHI